MSYESTIKVGPASIVENNTDVENDECGQVWKHNLNRINITTNVEYD
jgi:hypothetical protein